MVVEGLLASALGWLADHVDWGWLRGRLVRPKISIGEPRWMAWPSIEQHRRQVLAVAVANRGRGEADCKATIRVLKSLHRCRGFVEIERNLLWQDGAATYHLDPGASTHLFAFILAEEAFGMADYGRLFCGAMRSGGMTIGHPTVFLATAEAFGGQGAPDALCVGDFEVEVRIMAASSRRVLACERFLLRASGGRRVELLPAQVVAQDLADEVA